MGEREERAVSFSKLVKPFLERGDFSHIYACSFDLRAQKFVFEFDRGLTAEKKDVFDLASLTKALVVAPILMSEFFKKRAVPEVQLGEWLGEKRDFLHPSLGRLTLGCLLDHRSGLPAWRNLWLGALETLNAKERRELLISKLNFFAAQKSFLEPGYRYSDLGFIVLGLALEAKGGHSLATLFRDFCLRELEFDSGELKYAYEWSEVTRIVPTAFCALRNRVLVGEVHDENAAVLRSGGSGHAGLFGSGRGLVGYLDRFLSSDLGAWFLRELKSAETREQKSGHTLGWKRTSFSHREPAFGHLGFTGTAFWVLPQQQKLLVLLTNRVTSGRKSSWIQDFRRASFEALTAMK